MKKMIITNCPALTDQGECYQGSVFMGTAFKECQERTDCVLKRIVELCRKQACLGIDCAWCSDKCNLELVKFAKKILELLEIEEVDE